MRVITDLDQLDLPQGQTVLTIGNFDGVHLGHREIFRRVVKQAKEIGGVSAVLTFEPHPLRLLAPDKAPPRINTPDEKIRLIEASCIDLLAVVTFTHEFAAMPAADFVEEILFEKLGIKRLVVGYDYAFGHNREGDIDFLSRKARELGFVLDVLEPIKSGETIYSSTAIRNKLLSGDVKAVVEVLGRNFTLDGRVIHGEQRGRRLGFPTANLATEKEILPRSGVYAVKVKWQERLYDGVVNIGSRPTFAGATPSLEIHLLDFQGDLYDQTLRIYFVDHLRDEQRFASAQDLQDAVRNDIKEARRLLQHAEVVFYREYLDCGKMVGKECQTENS